MSHDPTPTQALLIFGLLARHGECAQAELMPAVKKADREMLVKAKLIGAGKVGRGLKLTLEDAGWAWATAHLSAELPPAQRALHDLLMRLDTHLTKRRVMLADFIGSNLEPPKPKKPKDRSVWPQIEKAYYKITGGRKNEAVRLSMLRSQLSRLSRKRVDEELLKVLKGDKSARLLRIDDPTAVTADEAAAAVQSSFEVFHILWLF